MRLEVTVNPRKVALVLGGIALYLALQSILLKHVEYAAGTESTYWLYHLVNLFNVNREGNIPTWYSTLLLLACLLCFTAIAFVKRTQGDRYTRHWVGLALVFLYLSLDEGAAIHEKLTIPIQEGLNVTGYLYFGWVIVGAAFVLGFLLLYVRFFFHLPPETQRLFLAAGVLYVGGALVVEAISANQWYLDSGTSLTFSTIGTLEELLEMWGAVVLLYALLAYLSDHVSEIRITTARAGEHAPEPEQTPTG